MRDGSRRSKGLVTAMIVAAAVLLVLLGSETAFAQGDTIIINIAGKPTTIERVTVGRETYRTVRYKVGTGASGSWQEESTDNVIEITHGDSPPNYIAADNAYKEGNWN